MKKITDMRVLTGLLHDSRFDFSHIRYARKRLTIPISRYLREASKAFEFLPQDKYILIDGELILYPVLYPCDWQITLSGDWIGKPEELQNISIISTKLALKTDKDEDLPSTVGVGTTSQARRIINDGDHYEKETWYHFKLELYNHMLPCYLDVLLRGWTDFPLIRYRDTSNVYDFETREPIIYPGGRR